MRTIITALFLILYSQSAGAVDCNRIVNDTNDRWDIYVFFTDELNRMLDESAKNPDRHNPAGIESYKKVASEAKEDLNILANLYNAFCK